MRIISLSPNGETLDKLILSRTGKITGFSRSLKLKRARMPFTDRVWSPGNKSYITNMGITVEPTHFKGKGMRSLEVALFKSSLSSGIMASLHGMIGAGFYHKWYIRSFWGFAWKLIGSASGLPEYNAYRYSSANVKYKQLHQVEVDVLVVGGGLSGIYSALHASNTGARVLLVEDHGELGGFLRYIDSYTEVIRDLEKKLRDNGVNILKNSKYIGKYMDGYAVVVPEGLMNVKPKSIVFATGGFNPLPVYINNDLPGTVDLEYALKISFLSSIANITIIGCNNETFDTAIKLRKNGKNVKLVCTNPKESIPNHLKDSILDARVMTAKAIGGERIGSITLSDDRTLNTELLVSGLIPYPDMNPILQLGVKPLFINPYKRFAPLHDGLGVTPISGVFVSGLSAGIFDRACSLFQAKVVGELAAEHAGFSGKTDLIDEYMVKCRDWPTFFKESNGLEGVLTPQEVDVWQSKTVKGLQFVDWDIDITIEDILVTYERGFDSMEKIKRYSGIGTAAEQGRMTIPTTLMILSAIKRVSMSKLGWFRIRPPHMLPTIGELAVEVS